MKNDAILGALDVLRCPICGDALTAENGGGSLVCQPKASGGKRHSFDRARSGYVNLDARHAGGGDSKELVRARTAFLESGAYEPISDKVNALLTKYATPGR